MKTAILLDHGVKQVMLTPETENEKQALKMISVEDNIHTVIKEGNFYDGAQGEIFGVDVYHCQGGYMRAKNDENSVMFVLTPKPPLDPINTSGSGSPREKVMRDISVLSNLFRLKDVLSGADASKMVDALMDQVDKYI